MSLALTQTLTALAAGLTASFQGVGGTAPYAYSVRANGASGVIDASTGIYQAPAVVPSAPAKLYDVIQVLDADGATATSQILVGTPLLLFCEVIQQEMGLANGRVYLWDQKIMQPTDSGLYIAVSVLRPKPFANTNKFNADGTSTQSVNMYADLQVDIISRGPEARDRKEELILALNSNYAQSQQEINSFYIGKLPPGAQFLNLSNIDGAAIPYRYAIGVSIQYFVTKVKAVPYFDTFVTPVPEIEP